MSLCCCCAADDAEPAAGGASSYAQLGGSPVAAAFSGSAGVDGGAVQQYATGADKGAAAAATPAHRDGVYAPLALREDARHSHARDEGRLALEPPSGSRQLLRGGSSEPPHPPARIGAAESLPLSPADALLALPTSPMPLPSSPSGSVFSAGFSPSLSPPPPGGFSPALVAPRAAHAGVVAAGSAVSSEPSRLSPLEDGELS